MKRALKFMLWLPAFVLAGCSTSFDEIKYSNGTADFTRLVAVGGSYLAGYSDFALYYEAQQNSVPALVASRLAFAESGPMIQPMVKPGVGIGIQGNAKWNFALQLSGCGNSPYIDSKPVASTGDNSNFNWLGSNVTFNNLAVPNTRIGDVTNQSYGNPSPWLGNPFYARFASYPGTSTITGDAIQVNPTFFIVWMGMEDIYNYACKGGDQGGDSITAVSVFTTKYNNLIHEMTSLGAQGVVMTIPSPGSIPYFCTIPYNGLELTTAEASYLDSLYNIVDPTISFVPGKNRYVIADPAEPTGRRQIKAGEFLLVNMPDDSLDCEGWGTTVPIPERYVLSSDEVTRIQQAVNQYNSAIFSTALSKNLAVADIKLLFQKMESGIRFNGASYSSDFPEGGLFSSDGYFPSQRGYGLIANEVINSINRKYNSKVPLFDINSLPGIVLP